MMKVGCQGRLIVDIFCFKASPQTEAPKTITTSLSDVNEESGFSSNAICDKRLLSDKSIRETASNQNKSDYRVAGDAS